MLGVLGFGRGVLFRDAIRGAETSAPFLYRVRSCQIVYSRLKAFEGAFAVVPEEADGRFVSNEFPTFDIDTDRLLPAFVSVLFTQRSFWAEVAAGSQGMGARRERLQVDDFLDVEVELPPLDEQRAIVEAVDATRRNAQAVDAATRAGLQAYAALLEELADGDLVPLSHLVSKIEAGMSPKCHDRRPKPEEWGVLKTAAVRHGLFRPKEAKALPDGLEPAEKAKVRPGDLLTIRASGSRRLVGALCRVPPGFERRLLLSDYHWRLCLSESVDPDYLMHVTAQRDVRSQIDDAIAGSTTAGKLSRERFLAVEIPTPSPEKQRSIARTLGAALEIALASAREAEAIASLRNALTDELVAGDRPIPIFGG